MQARFIPQRTEPAGPAPGYLPGRLYSRSRPHAGIHIPWQGRCSR